MENFDGVQVTFETGKKIRTWGGWYRHTTVKVGERIVGRIQERVRPGSKGRRDYLTCDTGSTCVLGSDVRWLLRVAGLTK
jgi:hypothetical protein